MKYPIMELPALFVMALPWQILVVILIYTYKRDYNQGKQAGKECLLCKALLSFSAV